MSNNRSIIKTDGSGLTLLAMRPVLAVQPRSSQLKGRQPHPEQDAGSREVLLASVQDQS